MTDMDIGFIGYGEVGKEMSKSMSQSGVEKIYAYDPLKIDAEDQYLSNSAKLTFFNTPAELVKNNLDILFMAVPSNKAKSAWFEVIDDLNKNTVLVDLTTASAIEKQDVKKELDKRGLNMNDGSILGALKVYQHKVPILVSGENTSKFIELGNEIGMVITHLNENVGDATNFKFVRSIFTKGLSTLLYEVFETAEKLGIEDEIHSSITDTMDRDPFDEVIDRYIKSNVPHSRRREKEMENVIDFMKTNDINPLMTTGTKNTLKKISDKDLDQKLRGNDYTWKNVIRKLNEK